MRNSPAHKALKRNSKIVSKRLLRDHRVTLQ